MQDKNMQNDVRTLIERDKCIFYEGDFLDVRSNIV